MYIYDYTYNHLFLYQLDLNESGLDTAILQVVLTSFVQRVKQVVYCSAWFPPTMLVKRMVSSS